MNAILPLKKRALMLRELQQGRERPGETRESDHPEVLEGWAGSLLRMAAIRGRESFTVQVKGKTEGKRIFYPLDLDAVDPSELERFERYSKGLTSYYEGRWDEARLDFASSGVMAASVFLQRLEGRTAPVDWSGVWTMESK